MPKFQGKWIGRGNLYKALDDLVPAAQKQLAEAQMESAQELAERIRDRAPVGDTGEYKASIKAARVADMPGKRQVGQKNKTKDPNAAGIYADYRWRWIEFGTRAHTIKGKNGGNLVFTTKDGKSISTRSVQHPGSPAQPHIFPTYRAFRKRIRRNMANAVNRAVKEVVRNSASAVDVSSESDG